jgi:hypothetical protein
MQVLPDEIRSVVILVILLITWEIVKKLVERFMTKTIDTEYMTVAGCRISRDDCVKSRGGIDHGLRQSLDDLGGLIDVLRGIVLVLAVKAGVDQQTLQDIARRHK